MKAKKIATVQKRIEKDIKKKYHKLSMVSRIDNGFITINKVTKKGNPPIYYQDIKKVMVIKDIDDSWKFYDKGGNKRIKYKDLIK